VTQDEQYMQLAIAEAAKAAAEGEIPVGAVVVRRGEVVAAAHNRREGGKNALAHAECLAIQEACRIRGGWRLWDCDLYVTMEPCPMCAGAIINSRIRRVVYGVTDAKAGCCGSVTDLFSLPFNHRPEVTAGVCAEEITPLVQDFFARLREELKTRPRWRKPADAETGSRAPKPETNQAAPQEEAL
jgi:tRNA(adenine34) deaminase